MKYRLKITNKLRTVSEKRRFIASSACSGFSLLETLVALAILTVTMLGPMTLASSSIRSASLSHNNVSASYLAEEVLEMVRAKRDSNIYAGAADWLDGLSQCTSIAPCTVDVVTDTIEQCVGTCEKLKYDSDSGMYGYDINWPDTIFTRYMYVEPVGSGNKEVKVSAIIKWRERFLLNDSTITLDESLFNWK